MSKKIHIHFVAKTFYPVKGGLEKSAHRITQSLSTIKGFQLHIYISGVKDFLFKENNFISTHDLREFVLEPYSDRVIKKEPSVPLGEENRVDVLILKNAILDNLNKYPDEYHVIVSFYASTTGFVCQMIADTLGLPHIASIRGSDFSRDLYSAEGLHAIDWVAKRASHIVTTNNEQQQMMGILFARNQNITTIYNAIEKEFSNVQWLHKKTDKIKLFSDSGFSFKKATHILLSTLEILISKQYPIQLHLVGEIEKVCEQYWKNLNIKVKTNQTENFIYYDYLNINDIPKMMLDCHIYVSSTLGEGCSNSRLQALSLGIPIVSTNTGELKDIVSLLGDNPLLELCSPGNLAAFATGLEKMLHTLQTSDCKPDQQYIASIHKLFSLTKERTTWESVIRKSL